MFAGDTEYMTEQQDQQQDRHWPLLPFERYMVEDDSHDYPMAFAASWVLRGAVDENLFRRAISDALSNHPLLVSKLARSSSGQRLERWVSEPRLSTDDGVFRTHWLASGVRFETTASILGCVHRVLPEWQQFDLESEIPLRVIWERESSDESRSSSVDVPEISRLLFVFHHAAADGIASLEFCGDVFGNYRRLTEDSGNSIDRAGAGKRRDRRADPKLLAERGVLDRTTKQTVDWWTAWRFSMRETIRFFTRPAIRLSQCSSGLAKANRDNEGESSVTEPRLDLWPIVLANDQTETLRRVAEEKGATLNELVMAVLMEVINAYLAQGKRGLRGWLAVLVPVNMRLRRRTRLPACNAIGYGFVKRSRREITTWETLLPGVISDLGAIQTWKLGGMFLDALQRQEGWPKWIQRCVRKWTRPATFVFSYIGDPFRRFAERFPQTERGCMVGELEIIDFAGAPPPRPGTELAVLGSVFASRLSLWCRVSRSAFPGGSFQELRERIAERLIEICDTELQSPA